MWKSLAKWLLKNVVEDLLRDLLAQAEAEKAARARREC